MQRSHVRLVLGVLVAVTSLIVAGAAGGASKKSTAGARTFGAEQEPPCLNGFTSGCNNTWTSWTAGIALASPLIVKPDFSIKPYMGTAKLVSKKPFTVLVTLNKKAKWSDGKQVSAEDLIFTWKTIVDPKFDISSRSGFDSIARAVKVNARAVKFIYSKPYAPYKVQWATNILPQHALEGLDFNTVWDSNYNNKAGQTMADGPFKLQSYTKGQSIVMVRNPTFWGKKPTLDKITFLFRTNTDTEIQAIRGGEVDAIYPQPQLQLAQLRGQAGLRGQPPGGPTTGSTPAVARRHPSASAPPPGTSCVSSRSRSCRPRQRTPASSSRPTASRPGCSSRASRPPSTTLRCSRGSAAAIPPAKSTSTVV